MARKAQRQTPREKARIAKSIASRGLQSIAAKKFEKDLDREVAQLVQASAVEICNGLAQAGPAWTGEFASAWDVVRVGTAGRPPREGGGGSLYNYTVSNFPLKRFENAIYIERRRAQDIKFEVVNSSQHASIALDLEEGIFLRPEEPPIKPIIQEGWRPQDAEGQDLNFRWQVGSSYSADDPNAAITAPKDWFITYSSGGYLQRDLGRGISLGAGRMLP
jgi:hypothetical protein